MEQVGALSSQIYLSGFDLFLQAGFAVKLVILVLVCASVLSWAVIFEKYVSLWRCMHQIEKFEEHFWSGNPLGQLYKKFEEKNVRGLPPIFMAAMAEWRKSILRGAHSSIGVETRIGRAIDVAMIHEIDYLERRLGLLATIGSSAPFVGLLGTVIGIMTSFQAIASSQSTNLSVVAPGIAEALLATAIGLIVAIPAVIAYNRLQEKVARIVHRLEGFSDEFLTILSRQIDEKANEVARKKSSSDSEKTSSEEIRMEIV